MIPVPIYLYRILYSHGKFTVLFFRTNGATDKMEKGLIGTQVVTQIGILVNDNAKTQPTLTLKINIIEKNHRY